jgi:hypothetical protein
MPIPKMPWRDIGLPTVTLREPPGDGLEIHLKSRTVAEGDLKDYKGMHFASGEVLTIEDGEELQHNVLIGTNEPRQLADLLSRALTMAAIDRTVSLFDDCMTLRVSGNAEANVDDNLSSSTAPTTGSNVANIP